MAVWNGPPKARKGHRIEDYQLNLLDVNRNWLGQLTNVHKPKGRRTVYGQFKGTCTFSLPLDNAWSKVLKEDELHKLQVLRDGIPIFEGYQVQLKRTDDGADTKSWNEFMFVPLARLLYFRFGKVISGTELSVTAKVDDAMKWIVERTGGPTSPVSGTSGTARAYAGLTVAANKTEHPTTITFNATLRNIYEALQWYGMSHTVDWDIYFDAAYDMIFETWYPQRGADKTAGSANPLIWTDTVMGIAGQDYGWDAQEQVTLVHDATMSADVVAAAGVRAKWLVKELAIATADTDEMQVVLNDKALRVWYLLRHFKETQDNQWGVDWNVGDRITWQSNRMGFGPYDDLISEVEWSIDEDGWETLKPILGTPELKGEDRLRGGGTGVKRPEYIAQRVWHLEDVANTAVDPDSQNTIMLYSSDDSAVVTADPAFHRMNIQSHWISAAGEITTRVVNDDVVPNGGSGTIGQSDDRWDAGYFVEGNFSGDVTIGTGKGIVHADSVAAGKVLIADGTRYIPADLSSIAGHAILSTTHTDSLAAGVSRGSIIRGNATPKWSELVIGAQYTHLESDGTTFAWQDDVTIATAKGIIHIDGNEVGKVLAGDNTRYVPTTIASLIGHAVLSATHTDTLAAGVSRGSIIRGNATPKWSELVIGAANSHLESDGNTFAWQANITMAAAATMDGVDLSVFKTAYDAHTHDYRKVDDFGGGGSDVYTGGWIGNLDGAPDYETNPLRQFTAGGAWVTALYWLDGNEPAASFDHIYMAEDNSGTNATWIPIGGTGRVGVGSQEHHHHVKYSDAQQSAGPN